MVKGLLKLFNKSSVLEAKCFPKEKLVILLKQPKLKKKTFLHADFMLSVGWSVLVASFDFMLSVA